jgi:hypothetical protein
MLGRTATTQETWEEKVAVGGPASHKDAQSKTMLIAHYALRRTTTGFPSAAAHHNARVYDTPGHPPLARTLAREKLRASASVANCCVHAPLAARARYARSSPSDSYRECSTLHRRSTTNAARAEERASTNAPKI